MVFRDPAPNSTDYRLMWLDLLFFFLSYPLLLVECSEAEVAQAVTKNKPITFIIPWTKV